MKISRRVRPGKADAWRLDVGIVDGRRFQRQFSTLQQAEAAMQRIQEERRRHGDAALAMPHEQRLRYAKLEGQLAAVGVTLEQAAQWAMERAGVVRERVRLPELKERYIWAKSRRRGRYVKQLGVVLRGFIAGRERVFADEVTPGMVAAWLSSNTWKAETQRNYLADLRALFAWAARNGHCKGNPCDGVELDSASLEEEREITAFGPEQIERLFEVALMHIGKRWNARVVPHRYEPAPIFRPLLGYLALATFAGVRPAEVQRSPRNEIHLEEKAMVITAGRAKTRRRRVVDLPDNALAWIRLWMQLCPDQKMIVPRNFRKLWEGLREASGLKPVGWKASPAKKRDAEEVASPDAERWPPDVLRHTAATMHYAFHQNTALLQAQLGHSEREDTLFQRYRAVRLLDGRPVTRSLAQKFWAIRPPAAT